MQNENYVVTKKTCQNTPLDMNYFDKYLQLFPSKFYTWKIIFLLFLGENLPLCSQKKGCESTNIYFLDIVNLKI
jgi:hypothetical protein